MSHDMNEILQSLDEELVNGNIENTDGDFFSSDNPPVNVDNINDLLDTKINVNAQALSIDSILGGLVEGYFVIPPFQRRYVWDKDKVAYLALSIIKNIPIPSMYVYVDKSTKRMVVLDGQQRMISVFLYFNDLTYSGSDNNINFSVVSRINDKLRELEKRKKTLVDNQTTKKEIAAIDKEINEIKRKLYEEHGMKRHSYTVLKDDQSTLDISFSEFDDDHQKYLIRKTMTLTTVDCNNEYPQKTYANIFKLLNSGGRALGEQEIRNGIYWETNLYKKLYEINAEENSVWRKIYGDLSIYSKDMEILLKAMALAHYVKLDDSDEGKRVVIDYPGFTWIKIMSDYSILALTDSLTDEIERMKRFLNSITGCEKSNQKCRKAVFEAAFVALSLAFPKMDKVIDYDALCNIGDSFGNILSSKSNVEERLNIALKIIMEMYDE